MNTKINPEIESLEEVEGQPDALHLFQELSQIQSQNKEDLAKITTDSVEHLRKYFADQKDLTEYLEYLEENSDDLDISPKKLKQLTSLLVDLRAKYPNKLHKRAEKIASKLAHKTSLAMNKYFDPKNTQEDRENLDKIISNQRNRLAKVNQIVNPEVIEQKNEYVIRSDKDIDILIKLLDMGRTKISFRQIEIPQMSDETTSKLKNLFSNKKLKLKDLLYRGPVKFWYILPQEMVANLETLRHPPLDIIQKAEKCQIIIDPKVEDLQYIATTPCLPHLKEIVLGLTTNHDWMADNELPLKEFCKFYSLPGSNLEKVRTVSSFGSVPKERQDYYIKKYPKVKFVFR